MYPASFDYHCPGSLEELFAIQAECGAEARLLAGGFSLVPAMKFRLAVPDHVIDLRKIPELQGIRSQGDDLVIGAMTTHYAVESSDVVKRWYASLAKAASVIADPQVRNRGTMGGSLCFCDPNADYPACILAFDAQLVALNVHGRRTIRAENWVVGPMTTALNDDEILTEIRFPRPSRRSGTAYVKILHPASRFATVGVAAYVSIGEDGRTEIVRVGITGAANGACRPHELERKLSGLAFKTDILEELCREELGEIEFPDDHLLTANDRLELCRAATRNALAAALSEAASK
ncbi:xanthine dehydrogenase family protein subunit M [Bradyrhizobium sp. CW7]|uniref:FAD binding domain-containing protein n=1 Tax=Bradyrhizobium sp. CW7 TaxID=2782688 RepID=UPI001FF9B3F6|nr:xanthine dehydrogenase family protein subunit M [Bradyrhizobium sp. CW7]MCK1356260.1 xanthine dehydrogenase family protein subunit M [Bradyrhizobium sp. CW7]